MTDTSLVVIRGNSGSGKSTVARRLRQRAGRPWGSGWALVEQDYLRRVLLWEKDVAGGLAPTLIEHNVRFLLGSGRHVVLEGILTSKRYGEMLRRLRAGHEGPAHFFYFDVSFAETVRRHGTRPQAREFTPDQMRDWYVERDLVDGLGETVIAESTSEDEALDLIARRAGVA